MQKISGISKSTDEDDLGQDMQPSITQTEGAKTSARWGSTGAGLITLGVGA